MDEAGWITLLANTPELALMALGMVFGYRLADKALDVLASWLTSAKKKVNRG